MFWMKKRYHSERAYQNGALDIVGINFVRLFGVLLIHLIQQHIDHVLVLLRNAPLPSFDLVLVDDPVQELVNPHSQLLHALFRAAQVQGTQPGDVVADHERP